MIQTKKQKFSGAWYLVIGGENGGGKLKTIELYNWQTKETCFLPDLPYGVSGMVGTIINGSQVFCGGETTDVQAKCYKLELSTLAWIEVGQILRKTCLMEILILT
jgi:hypothetical protein